MPRTVARRGSISGAERGQLRIRLLGETHELLERLIGGDPLVARSAAVESRSGSCWAWLHRFPHRLCHDPGNHEAYFDRMAVEVGECSRPLPRRRLIVKRIAVNLVVAHRITQPIAFERHRAQDIPPACGDKTGWCACMAINWLGVPVTILPPGRLNPSDPLPARARYPTAHCLVSAYRTRAGIRRRAPRGSTRRLATHQPRRTPRWFLRLAGLRSGPGLSVRFEVHGDRTEASTVASM
jgi:hypothetical protein